MGVAVVTILQVQKVYSHGYPLDLVEHTFLDQGHSVGSNYKLFPVIHHSSFLCKYNAYVRHPLYMIICIMYTKR